MTVTIPPRIGLIIWEVSIPVAPPYLGQKKQKRATQTAMKRRDQRNTLSALELFLLIFLVLEEE
jgi:hypothetical protein